MFANVFNAMIVGQMLGTDSLAAINLSFPIIQFMAVLYFMFGIGGSTLAATFIGKKELENASKIFSSTLIGLLGTTIVISTLGVVFLHPLANFLAQGDQNLAPLIAKYIFPMLLSAPIWVFVAGILYFVRTDSMPKVASICAVSADIVNLSVNAALIKIFHFDITSAGISYSLGYTIALLILLTYFLSKKRSLKFKFTFDLRRILSIMKSGFSPGLSSILMFFKQLFVSQVMLFISGPIGAVAWSVCKAMISVNSMFISGGAQTMMPIVGKLFGEQNHIGINYTFKKTAKVIFGCVGVEILLIELFPKVVARLFGVSDQAELDATVSALHIFAPALFGIALAYLLLYFANVIQRHKIAVAISIAEGIAFLVPLVILLAYFIGVNGVWLGFTLSELLACAVGLCFYKQMFVRG
jgi:Na+-driven multidrug efflux pump